MKTEDKEYYAFQGLLAIVFLIAITVLFTGCRESVDMDDVDNALWACKHNEGVHHIVGRSGGYSSSRYHCNNGAVLWDSQVLKMRRKQEKNDD